MKFRYYKPKDKVSRFNEYFDLLEDLYHNKHGYTEEEFLYLIESSNSYDAEPSYIFQTLLSYELIVESNDHITRYTLSLPHRTFLEYLYLESQPVSSSVILGFIKSLSDQIQNLSDAYEKNSLQLTRRHLNNLAKAMDSIAQTSSRNRLGIISEVRKLKYNEEKLEYKERLQESNRLWDEFLEPLREMIAPSGAFGELMDRLKQTLDSGEAQFSQSVELRQLFVFNRGKRMRLNEQARHDLSESIGELSPLREKLVQDSQLLDATAVIFSQLEQGKLNEQPSLSLGRLLTHEREICIFGLAGFLADLWGIEAEPENIEFDEPESIDASPLERDEVLSLLQKMPEGTDVIKYFLLQHEKLTANEVFRAVSIATMHQNDTPVFAKKDREYVIQGETWRGSAFIKIQPQNGEKNE